jgi:hypothetical protein
MSDKLATMQPIPFTFENMRVIPYTTVYSQLTEGFGVPHMFMQYYSFAALIVLAIVMFATVFPKHYAATRTYVRTMFGLSETMTPGSGNGVTGGNYGNWYAGNMDAGNGGSMDRDATRFNAEVLGYNGFSQQCIQRGADGTVGPTKWDPAAIAELNALRQTGSYTSGDGDGGNRFNDVVNMSRDGTIDYEPVVEYSEGEMSKALHDYNN